MTVITFIRQWTAGHWPLKFIVVLVALCAASYVVLNSGARYAPAPLPPGAGLPSAQSAPPSDLRAWQRSPHGVTFVEQDGTLTASLQAGGSARGERRPPVLWAAFTIPERTDALRLRFRAAGESLMPGDEPWQAARAQILSFDRGGQLLWYWPSRVIRFAGHRPLGPVSAVVPIGPDIAAAILVIYNGADSGVMRVGPVGVSHLVERPVFAALRYGLVLAWGLAGLWIAGAVLRRAANLPMAAVFLGTLLLALAGTLTPQPTFRELSAPVEAWALTLANVLFKPRPEPTLEPAPPVRVLEQAEPDEMAPRPEGSAPKMRGAETPAPPSETARATPPPSGITVVAPPAEPGYPFSFKQVSHFAMFLLLGLAGFSAFPRAPWLGRLACLAGFAAVTEALQWFVVTRGSQLSDLAVDAAGLLLAGALVAAGEWALARVRRKTKAFPV